MRRPAGGAGAGPGAQGGRDAAGLIGGEMQGGPFAGAQRRRRAERQALDQGRPTVIRPKAPEGQLFITNTLGTRWRGEDTRGRRAGRARRRGARANQDQAGARDHRGAGKSARKEKARGRGRCG